MNYERVRIQIMMAFFTEQLCACLPVDTGQGFARGKSRDPTLCIYITYLHIRLYKYGFVFHSELRYCTRFLKSDYFAIKIALSLSSRASTKSIVSIRLW